MDMKKLLKLLTMVVLLLSASTIYAQTYYYWNGGNAGSTTISGGTGTWTTANAWVTSTNGTLVATNSGTAASTWVTANPAIIEGTAGTITIANNTTVSPTSTTVNTTGFSIIPSSTGATTTLAGSVALAANVNLNFSNTTTTVQTIVLSGGSVTGGSGSSLTVGGPQTGYAGSTLILEGPTAGVSTPAVCSVPVIVNGSSATGCALVNFGGGTATYANFTGGITIAPGNSNLLVVGTSSPDAMEVNGINCSSSSNLTPVIISNKATGSGKFAFYLTGTSNYYGPTYLAGNSTGSSVVCYDFIGHGGAGGAALTSPSLSPNSVLIFGADPSVTGAATVQSSTLDVYGTNETVAGLSTNATVAVAATNVIENTDASTTGVFTVNQGAGVVETFPGTIINNAGNISLVLEATGTGSSLTLSGANTFTGGLTLNTNGNLIAGANNTLGQNLPVTFSGGTFATSIGTTGYTQGSSLNPLGALNVTANSTLTITGTNTHSLYFGSYGGGGSAWAGTLTITGWDNGNMAGAGASGTTGQIFIGNSASLTTAQLAKISFTGFSNGATQLSSGEIVPAAANPTASLSPVSPLSGSEALGTVYTVSVSVNPAPTSSGTVGFTITGIQSTQVVGGSLTGTINIAANATSGSATFTVQNDNIYEGTETGSVTISGTTGGVTAYSASAVTFTLIDDVSFWWNGGTASPANPSAPNGGTGTWSTANAWIAIPGTASTGAPETWVNNQNATFAGTAGTVTLSGSETPTSSTISTTGYVFTPSGATAETIAGPITLGNSVNVTFNQAAATTQQTIDYSGGSISGGTSATMTVTGAQSGSSVYSGFALTQPATVSVPVIINGTGGGYIAFDYNAGAAGTSTLTSGVQIASTNTSTVILGGTATYTLQVNGITSPGGSSNTSPVEITNHIGGSGAGTFIFGGASNYYGPTFLELNSSTVLTTGAVVQCSGNSVLSPNSVIWFGGTDAVAGQGPNLDLNGTSQTVAGITESASATGNIMNRASSPASLTVNQAAGLAETFSLPIVNGPGTSTTALTLGAAGTGSSLTLTSTSNTFTGGLTLNSNGNVIAGAVNILAAGVPVTFNGGSLATAASQIATGLSQGSSGSPLGAISLTANSSITLGSGVHSLAFSGPGTFTGGTTLTINGWTGSTGPTGTSSAGKITIGGTPLTTGQLAQIQFSGYAAGADQISGTGEIVPSGSLLDVALIAVTPSTGSETAGTTYTIQVNTTSAVVHNSSVNYTVTGLQLSQIASGSLSGTLTVTAGNSSATTTITVQNDNIFEGTETATVALVNGSETGDISYVNPSTTTFTVTDDATFYWNGGTPSSNPAAGGSGNWSTTNAWLAPTNTGTQETWVDGYAAVLAGTAGTVNLTATVNPTSVAVNTNNYAISSTGSTLNGNITIAASDNLNFNDPAATTATSIIYGGTSLTGGAGSTIGVVGNQASSTTVYSAFAVANPLTISLPVTMNATGGGYVTFNYNAGATGTTELAGGVTIANNTPAMAGVVLGGTAGYTMQVDGITGTGGSANTVPVIVSNHPAGSGKGTFIFNGTSNYYGTTYLSTNAGGLVTCNAANCLSPNSILDFGTVSGGASGQGPNLDLEGYSQTVAGLTTSNGAVGSILNSGTSGNTVLTINQPAATTNSFGLVISNGASATTSIVLGAAGAGSSLTLSGANTFTGGLTVNANGNLIAGATNTLAVGLPVTLNGGQLSTSTSTNSTGYSEQSATTPLGALTVSSNSTIQLGNTVHSIYFANSSGATWSGLLTITGWQGTNGVTGTYGHIYFEGAGLTATQLNTQIQFAGFPIGATLLGTGEIVPTNPGATVVYANATGTQLGGSAAIWSFTSGGTGSTISSLIGGFTSTYDVVIQTGTVEIASTDNFTSHNLTVNSGAALIGTGTAPINIESLGNITINGSLGVTGGTDGLALRTNGTTQTLSGTGSVNLLSISKSTTVNATTALTISNNVNLWQGLKASGSASLYSSATPSEFDVTVSSGSTVNFENVGAVSTDGGSGSASSVRNGLFTVNGSMTNIYALFATSQNTFGSTTHTGYAINNGGSITAKDIQMQIGGDAGLTFTVAVGGTLTADSVLELVAPTTVVNNPAAAFAPAGTVVLASTSSTSVAYIDNFSGAKHTGTYSGNITAQRYFDASLYASQHLIGSPVNNPTFSQLSATGTSGYLVDATCDETKTSTGSPYGTLFSYNEAHGSTCEIQSWYTETSGSSTLNNGQGYSYRYIGATTVSLTGAPNLNSTYAVSSVVNGGASSSLTNSGFAEETTLQGRPMNPGFDLVSNPYPATLAIGSNSNQTANNANFGSFVYVFETEGVHQGAYVATTTVAPFQAFHVNYTNTGSGATYTLYGVDRTTSATQFYKQANNTQLVVTSTNTSTGLVDETTVAFNTAATTGYDAMYDAYKLPGELTRHTMYTVANNGRWMAINTQPSISDAGSIPMGFEPGVSGTYTLSFDGLASFDPTSYIMLEDKQTGTMYNVRSGAYTFTSNASDNWNRFVLHFTPAATISTTAATCSEQGMINITQPGTANWNYSLVDNNNAVVSSGTLNAGSPVVASVSAGVYTATLVDNNGYTVVKNIQVTGAETVVASFDASATSVMQDQQVSFTSTGNNATSYNWNFGDGNTATGTNAAHTYETAGVYNVTLEASNTTGCSSASTRTIHVSGTSTGINNISYNNNIAIWSNDNKVYVDFAQVSQVQATVTIYNIIGQEIFQDKVSNNGLFTKEIDNIEAGYLVVNVKNGDSITTRKVFIANSK